MVEDDMNEMALSKGGVDPLLVDRQPKTRCWRPERCDPMLLLGWFVMRNRCWVDAQVMHFHDCVRIILHINSIR